MTRLRPLSVHPVPGFGAEDVAVGSLGRHAGYVFTGTEDGSIIQLSQDGNKIERVAQTAGRPLGIEIDPDGDLIVCDARRGLLRVDPLTGSVTSLTETAEGRRLVFCNNAAVATNGDIWFSDSSTRFGIDHWKNDVVQNTRTGRLLRRREDGTVEVVLRGLAFANGVALSSSEDFVCVAETGARTVARYWISGERAGTRDHLVTDLPGYPDNISRGTDGLIWVSIASPTDPVVEKLQTGPTWLSRQVTRLPAAVQPAPKRTVRVQAYNTSGKLVHDLSAAGHGFHMVTGVREHDGQVWLGSLHEPAVAVMTVG